jgi:predicted nucleic acid-binding protein
MYLLDSNVVIDYLDNKLPTNSNEFLDKIKDPIISVASRIELSIFPNYAPEKAKILEEYINYCTILNMDEDVVLKIIELRKKYKIRDFDSIIAATALVYNFPLITNDKGFLNIKDLKVINPFTFDFV